MSDREPPGRRFVEVSYMTFDSAGPNILATRVLPAAMLPLVGDLVDIILDEPDERGSTVRLARVVKRAWGPYYDDAVALPLLRLTVAPLAPLEEPRDGQDHAG